MDDIFYELGNNIYANLTNKCCCRCNFCIRNFRDSVGSASNLWLDKDPELDDIISTFDKFDPKVYEELVFCGYGEPTYAFENMIALADYVHDRYNLHTRLNTNGLGNLINNQNIVPLIASHIDSVSVSLNAPDAEAYEKICAPEFKNAYEELLSFTKECHNLMEDVTLSVVDIIDDKDIKKCRTIAENLGVNFRIRNDM